MMVFLRPTNPKIIFSQNFSINLETAYMFLFKTYIYALGSEKT